MADLISSNGEMVEIVWVGFIDYIFGHDASYMKHVVYDLGRCALLSTLSISIFAFHFVFSLDDFIIYIDAENMHCVACDQRSIQSMN